MKSLFWNKISNLITGMYFTLTSSYLLPRMTITIVSYVNCIVTSELVFSYILFLQEMASSRTLYYCQALSCVIIGSIWWCHYPYMSSIAISISELSYVIQKLVNVHGALVMTAMLFRISLLFSYSCLYMVTRECSRGYDLAWAGGTGSNQRHTQLCMRPRHKWVMNLISMIDS